MRYSFVEKTSHRQQETAYMLYMIIGSYFHRCRCKSKAVEENLFLYYKELREKKQVEKESKRGSVERQHCGSGGDEC